MNVLARHGPLRAAARVAAVTTVVAAVLYTIVAVAILGIAQRLQTDAVDQDLYSVASFFQEHPERLVGFQRDPNPSTLSTTYGWFFGSDGQLRSTTPGAPNLPSSLAAVSAPTSATVGGTRMRLLGAPVDHVPLVGSGYVVFGETTHFIDQVLLTIGVSEVILAVPLLVIVFLAALAIGRWSAAPIERARRQLLGFTADASHELRTPLQVIEAEVSLALQRQRSADSYRGSIERIRTESGRLRRLVDDLLWLARFDNQPVAPAAELVDVGAAAATAVARFEAVAARRGQKISLQAEGGGSAWVAAPEAWVERLLGVLLDNACRYSPEEGEVTVGVAVADGRVTLTVDDSGPGIATEERPRVFERFHRAAEGGGGAGLGLAIGDAVVRSTGGRWQIADSPAGGARVAVSWELARTGRGGRRRQAEAPQPAPEPAPQPVSPTSS